MAASRLSIVVQAGKRLQREAGAERGDESFYVRYAPNSDGLRESNRIAAKCQLRLNAPQKKSTAIRPPLLNMRDYCLTPLTATMLNFAYFSPTLSAA
jgi:hypothetical protein